MKLGYIKHDKFIITIADLSTIPYHDLMKYSSTTNNFKILSIEDIMGNYYDSNEFSLYYGRFFDRDIYEIHYTKSMKIQINDVINNVNNDENLFCKYFYDKTDAFYSNFFVEKQWKLFKSGYTNLCKFNIDPSYTFEFLFNNGKVLGVLKIYIKNQIFYEILFDKINLNGIIEYYVYENNKIEEKIEIKKEEFMSKVKEINLFQYLDYN